MKTLLLFLKAFYNDTSQPMLVNETDTEMRNSLNVSIDYVSITEFKYFLAVSNATTGGLASGSNC